MSMQVFMTRMPFDSIQGGSKAISIGSVRPLYRAHTMMKRSQYW